MKNKFLYIVKTNLILLSILFYSSQIFPCNIPVFRYALERWTADPYILTIYYKEAINEENNTLLTELETISFKNDSLLNLEIQYKDISVSSNKSLEYLPKNLTFPIIMLNYPSSTGIPYPMWFGELNNNNIELIKNSPSRKKISKLLLEGKTSVFLFLESSNSELNQKYFIKLKNELNDLSNKLKIPTIGTDINGNKIEVKKFQDEDINFSIVKLSRDNPAEKIFIDILLGTESDLSEFQVPLVFPIFGRGRSLYTLVGSGINRKNIEKACRSLVDWCSCEIKTQHQGVDLLFLTDWSKTDGESWIQNEEIPQLTGLSLFVPETKRNDSSTILRMDSLKTSFSQNSKESSKIDSNSTNNKIKIHNIESFSISNNIFWLIIVITMIVIITSLYIKITRKKQ